MANTSKSIWIDLDNSPHVPLFVPIIKHYRDSGVEVFLTARDHAQTVELLNMYGLGGTFSIVGRHYGRGKISKVAGLIKRAMQLVSTVNDSRQEFSVAISHGSRSMVLAARWLGLKVVSMYDYEFTETGIFNRFSDKVLVPEAIPYEALDAIGLDKRKRVKYPGIKEELYIRNFTPDPAFRQKLLSRFGVEDRDDLALVVLRPPATTANYHDETAEAVNAAVLERLRHSEHTVTIVVPRDRAADAADPGTRVFILNEPVDGLDLINASDVVISGGGTMNREAALLGVPVYSTFAGRQGALDAAMERDGLITFIRETSDVDKIKLEPRTIRTSPTPLTDRVEKFVIAEIDRFL